LPARTADTPHADTPLRLGRLAVLVALALTLPLPLESAESVELPTTVAVVVPDPEALAVVVEDWASAPAADARRATSVVGRTCMAARVKGQKEEWRRTGRRRKRCAPDADRAH
jgi:hypothetical protein